MPDGVCDALLERDQAAGYFAIISRQRNILAPKDGKERYLVAERLEFEKIQRRIRKGIERYLDDPKRKQTANQSPQRNASATSVSTMKSPVRHG